MAEITQLSLWSVSYEEQVENARTLLSETVGEWKPDELWCAVSGGQDSLPAALLASRHPLFRGVLHINTGIGVPETSEYVRNTCHRQGWPLKEFLTDPSVYDNLVLRYGFPGPAMHSGMYQRLKERRIREFKRERKAAGAKLIGLVTGCRRDESRRRMGTTKPVDKQGSLLWIAPLIDASKSSTRRILTESGVPPNPVSQLLCMSGECLCGAFAENDRSNELGQLELFYPEVANRIHALEARARDAGVHAKWGVKPPVEAKPLCGPFLDLMMCHSCQAKQESRIA